MMKLRKMAQILSMISMFTLSMPIFSYSPSIRCEINQKKIINKETDINKLLKKLNNIQKANQEALNHYLLNQYMEQIIQKYHEQIEKEKIEQQELAKQHELINRGISDFSYSKEVLCHVTYYTNNDDRLQGGHTDKKGNYLVSHDEPIIALPRDIPYGSYLVFDEPVLGETIYKNVDTGGAIIWLNDYEMKVDVFVSNVSLDWIINNLNNKIVSATLYYK